MGRPRKVRTEGEATPLADPVPGDNGAALARIAAYFRQNHPAEWEAMRLCPLQHGLDEMARKLG